MEGVELMALHIDADSDAGTLEGGRLLSDRCI
jgi:hypothetical protein